MALNRSVDARPPDNDDYCRAVARTGDRDAFLASLFAPAPARGHLNALSAFAVELAGTRARVSEAMLGELRLQWWRDALDTIHRGDATGNPIADGLGRAIIEHRLAREPLEAMIDARAADLHGEQVESLEALERYLRDTEAPLFSLGAVILEAAGAPDELARHAGVARGLVRLLNELATSPWRASFLPRDLMAVHGIAPDAEPVLDGAAMRPVLADLRATARHHLERVRAGFQAVGPAILPAFLPLATVPLDLRRLERAPLARGGGAPVRRQVAIYLAARRGRI